MNAKSVVGGLNEHAPYKRGVAQPENGLAIIL